MKRLIGLVVIFLLVLPVIGAAQKKEAGKAKEAESGPMCPMMEKMKQQKMKMEMMGQKDVVTWWQRGVMSQKLRQISNQSGALLAGGNLPSEAQKQLAGVVQDVGELIPQIFSPQGIQNPDEVKKKLTDLETTLGKIKAQAKP